MNKAIVPPEVAEKQVEITIIILTFNSEVYIENCVQSLFKSLENQSFEVIIIDNKSKDGTKHLINQLATQYNFIRIFNEKNNGVAKSRNQGISISRGNFIMFLDVDTIVFPMAIESLIKYMIRNPKCGLLAPRLISPEGRTQFSCQKFPTFFTKLLRQLPSGVAKRFLADTEMRKWHHRDTITSDWVIGACQLIRRNTIEKVGLLDEKFFYGAEDIDYCIRIWRGGYQVVYHPESIVVHYEQRIVRNQLFNKLSFYHFIGLCYYFIKYKYLFSTREINRSIPEVLRSGQL